MNLKQNTCCFACIYWRTTQQGKGQCMNLKIYTSEEFGCTDFTEGEYQTK